MSLRFNRSRQLAAEIENTEFKWGVRVIEPTDENMRVEAKKNCSKMQKALKSASDRRQPAQHVQHQRSDQRNEVQEKRSQTDCQQKTCYCREEMKSPQKSTRKTEEKVTWDQILSQHVNLGSGREQLPAKGKQYCQVEENIRPVERPRSLGNEKMCRRVLDDWCHPECFVEDLAHNEPANLLGLKTEIDKAVKRMGLKDRCPQEEPTRDYNRPKVVLEYLEDLSLEMVKKRLEESESRYKNMRKKLEDALVTYKMEIKSLKSELFIKNEEVTRLMKSMQQSDSGAAKKKEFEFVDRISSLDDRIKLLLERDEKANRELEKHQRAVAELKIELSKAREERDLFHAKMEIYQQERDKAVATLSVYEKTFKNLKHEIGQEIRGIGPPLDLTADSCGTLDTTGREPREVVTSSPNTSFRAGSNPIDYRKKLPSRTPPKTKKRTKHTLANSAFLDARPISSTAIENKENAGEVLLQKLEVLGKEFKQFSENVFPLALKLDDEANQLLNVSTSTGLSWTDLNSDILTSSHSSPP